MNTYWVVEVGNCVILEHAPAFECYRHCAWLKWLAAWHLAYFKNLIFSWIFGKSEHLYGCMTEHPIYNHLVLFESKC